jgi:hypothetical protein
MQASSFLQMTAAESGSFSDTGDDLTGGQGAPTKLFRGLLSKRVWRAR